MAKAATKPEPQTDILDITDWDTQWDEIENDILNSVTLAHNQERPVSKVIVSKIQAKQLQRFHDELPLGVKGGRAEMTGGEMRWDRIYNRDTETIVEIEVQS